MAFSAMEALQAFGMGRQMAVANRQLERQEATYQRQESTRGNVSRLLTAGDYQGATAAAVGGGEYDLAGTLNSLGDNQRQQAIQEARIISGVATSLRRLPADQRQSAYERIMPQLRGLGLFSEQELTGVDLSDQGLDGYISFSSQIAPPRQGEGFTLSEGQIRFDANGQPIARGAPQRPRYYSVPPGGRLEMDPAAQPAPQEAVNPQTGERLRLNPQTNQWEPVQGGPTPPASGTFQ